MTSSWQWAHVTNPLFTHFDLLDPYDHIVVGYSGGLDSTVLLHLLSSVKKFKEKVTAIHVNHQLHPASDDWEAHCRRQAEALQIRFHSALVSIHKAPQQSLEEQARTARYGVFDRMLNQQSCLVLGHHQVDQAETVLLQLMRGAGVHGLSGMPLFRETANYPIIRPLLPFDKKRLSDYANEHHLNWIEDPSNQDRHLKRNYIRHEILPSLTHAFPKAQKSIVQSASLHQEMILALDELIEPYVEDCLDEENRLCTSTLIQYSPPIQQIVLRKWLRLNHIRMPNRKRLNQFISQLATAPVDKAPQLAWDDNLIVRFQHKLYLNPLTKRRSGFSEKTIVWKHPFTPLTLPGKLGILKLEQAKKVNRLAIPPNSHLSVQFRKGGEQIFLNHCHRKLKKLFQIWAIPPWERESMPLLYIDNELAAIPGYCISDHFDKIGPHSYHLSHIS